MHRIKVETARLLCKPSVGLAIGVITHQRIRTRGIVIEVNGLEDSIKAALFWGLYESTEARFVERHIRTGLPVIELGSSIGFVTCLIRRGLERGIPLVCVEANSELIPVIHRNLEINGLHDHVSIVNRAIDYSSDEVNLISGDSNIDSRVSRGAPDGPVTARVATTTLSDVIHEHKITGLYVLVSDIEGAEASILAHDAKALENCAQIIIELHRTTVDGKVIQVEDMISQLENAGFRLTNRHGSVCVFAKGE